MSPRSCWIFAPRKYLATNFNFSCNSWDTFYVPGGGNPINPRKAPVIRINEPIRLLVTCQALNSTSGSNSGGSDGTHSNDVGAAVSTKEDQNVQISGIELKKISEEIIRLKVLDEADGEYKRKIEDDIRRLSDEVIRLKTQDEIRSKFVEAEKSEQDKVIDELENRIKSLDESKINTKDLLQGIGLQIKEGETKVGSLDQKMVEIDGLVKNLQNFRIKGETEFKDLKLKVEDKDSRLKELEDFKVKELARKEAETESKKKVDENEKIKKAENVSEEDNKLKALIHRITEEEARLKKLEEDRIKEDSEINELKIKLVEKEGRIRALEDFQNKEEARRKAWKETREKEDKKRSEETQKYFAMIGILVTTATSLGLFYIDHMYKKSDVKKIKYKSE